MIQLTDKPNEIWAVEVPSMAFGFDINNYGNESELMYTLPVDEITDAPEHQHDETLIVKKLPFPGSWRYICTSKEVTEEQLKDIVRELPMGKRYYNYNGDFPVWYHTRKDSLNSLLASKGLDNVNGNYVYLENLNNER